MMDILFSYCQLHPDQRNVYWDIDIRGWRCNVCGNGMNICQIPTVIPDPPKKKVRLFIELEVDDSGRLSDSSWESDVVSGIRRIPELFNLHARVLHIGKAYPCATCGYARTCGDPPGEDCHS